MAGDNGSGRNGANVWRWIAALLAAIMLAGSPGIVFALRAPTPEQVEIIRDRQQLILQHLATIDAQLTGLNRDIEDLRLELRRHEEATERGR